MSSSFEVLDVKNYLKSRFITTSSEWIEACIAFLKEEHTGGNLSSNSLKESVYNQWLSADLEEIGASSLPQELPTVQKTTLNSSFALQVNFVRDVGKPAYAQLKDLNKQANSNEEFSAAPKAPLPPWEKKPTRMLMLNLTDGRTTVQGMEYRPISALSLSLTPRVKVLIQGPVDCRFGVFLLTPEKIKVLGGEVESKLRLYSQQNLLRELLNLPLPDESPTENNPIVNNTLPSTHDFENGSPSSLINNTVQHHSDSSITSNSNRNISVPGQRTRQNVVQRPNRGAPNTLTNYFSSQNPVARQNQESVDDLDAFEDEDDDFVQSLDYEAINELEKENSITRSENIESRPDDEDIWQEDEDVLQDLMNFQEETPMFEIPDENESETLRSPSDSLKNTPFTYLSAILNENPSDCTVTIKGFIISVLSKLECTVDKGWNLCVKINDGTATLVANLHDKVLEGIIGVSAVEMVQLQKLALQDQTKRKEASQVISKCKLALQDFNCIMDIQFLPDSKPCIVKCHPVTQLHLKQLMDRVRSQF